ncbi:GMP synthase [Pseudovibrio japonicus]|uniref:GMP synthase n=1 Tax=Pseudovibrio japonicus TaxID=366534 RepID=A0ABQ3E404_9HYPH|nr:type 1 glutamine amidotransferase [Pseudovibrio japonicus]GHB22694.1 GMP synthase [Pseudovibrio japonicus]
MTVLVVENCEGVTLGLLGEALSEAKMPTDLRVMADGHALPSDISKFKGLVVLGGIQHARADEELPFLKNVCDTIIAFEDADKPVMGICLGSQLIARAFGGDNILGNPVEAGWLPLHLTDQGRQDPVLSALGENDRIFSLHTDTFTLPEGAVHLASSEMTPNQAFKMGRATYAMQFHFEASVDLVKHWDDRFNDEISDLVPNWQEIINEQGSQHGPKADALGLEISRRWIALL